MMNELVNLIFDNKEWLFSGIGVTVLLYFLNAKQTTVINNNHSYHYKNDDEIDDNEFINKKEIKELSYAEIIGNRHKQLRENILELSKRDMVEFYKLDSVTTLEKYESGEIELPLNKIEKLEKFFFIKKNFLETGNYPIFDSFYLNKKKIIDLLDEGFSPIIVCSPKNRDNFLYAYIVMFKNDNGFTRMIISNIGTPGSFRSNGGGRMNIEYLIYAMKEYKIDKYDISILKIDEQDFINIEKGEGYKKELYHGFGRFDTECADIFYKWYDEII